MSTMNSCRAYVYAVAAPATAARPTRQDAAGAILLAAEKATKMALDAIQLLGGNGYINDYPTGRLLRDAKLYEIGAGTSEIRRMLIGRELFAMEIAGAAALAALPASRARGQGAAPRRAWPTRAGPTCASWCADTSTRRARSCAPTT
jgi:hypothetical protein